MPLYEYACDECHANFEILVRGDEQPTCPRCSSTALVKQLSVPAAHTAGGGGLPMYEGPPCGMGGCGRPECD